MKNTPLSLAFLLLLLCAYSQNDPLSIYEHQIGKTWVIEAKWGDGSLFKQEITMEYGLNGTIVVAKTKGFTNQERTDFGERNHGIRKFNVETGKIEFWEFDTFGGVTQGEVLAKGKDVWYVYEYMGTTLADIWQYRDERTYEYRVVNYKDETVGETYLTGTYRLKE